MMTKPVSGPPQCGDEHDYHHHHHFWLAGAGLSHRLGNRPSGPETAKRGLAELSRLMDLFVGGRAPDGLREDPSSEGRFPWRGGGQDAKARVPGTPPSRGSRQSSRRGQPRAPYAPRASTYFCSVGEKADVRGRHHGRVNRHPTLTPDWSGPFGADSRANKN
jgi:hypothetical protein